MNDEAPRPAPVGLLRRLAPAAGLAAGVVFLYLVFRDVSLGEVARRLAGGRWLPAAPAILAGVAVFLIAKARRWRALLGDPARIALLGLVRPVSVGLLFNALMAHTGEFARALALQRRYGLPVSSVLVGIAVERLFDLLVVLLFALIAGGSADLPASLAPALRVVGTLAALLGAGILLALFQPLLMTRLVGSLSARLPARPRAWLERQLAEALGGLEPLRTAHRVPVALGWSFVQWGSIVWCIHYCAEVPGVGLSVATAALVLVAVVLVFTLPNAPGYLGSTQLAFLAVLAPLGVAKEQAIAASFVYTLVVVVPMMMAGAVALMLPARAGAGR